MNPTITGIVAFLQLFFSRNPLVEEIIAVVSQVGPAFAAAQQGKAFTVSFPESISGIKGTSTFAWTPNSQ